MPELPKRTLGRTGLEVTTLGYGAMELRGARAAATSPTSRPQRILNAVLDAGINFIDTSIDYGVAEERIGKPSRTGAPSTSSPRSAAAWPATWRTPPPARETSAPARLHRREHPRRASSRACARMKTDHLDLVQFHRASAGRVRGAGRRCRSCRSCSDEGKVRFIGVSGTLPNLTSRSTWASSTPSRSRTRALQRDHEDADRRRPREAGAGIIIRGGAAQGRARAGSRATSGTSLAARSALDDLLDGMTRMEFILRFTFSDPDLDTTIVGTINPDHLQDNIDALLKGPLPREIYEEAKKRLAEAGSDRHPRRLTSQEPGAKLRRRSLRLGA